MLSKRLDNGLFSQLTINKANAKVALPFSNAKLENSVFELTRNRGYFVVNDATVFLLGDSDRRASCLTQAAHVLASKCSNFPLC